MNYQDLAALLGAQGRYGDTELVHVTPREKEMLRRSGGSGSTNPTTGLDEYFDVSQEGQSLGSPASEGLGLMEGMQAGSVAGPLEAPQEIGAHPQATGTTVGSTNIDPSPQQSGSLLGGFMSNLGKSGFNPNQPESMIVNALGLAVPGFGLMRGFDALATTLANALGYDVAKGPATGMVGSDVTVGSLTPADLGGKGQYETLSDPTMPSVDMSAPAAAAPTAAGMSSSGLAPYMRDYLRRQGIFL